MDLKHLPLNLPLGKTKNLGEGRVIYSFEKDQHAKLLLKNLAKMQADGVLTDVIIQTRSKDREESFHSMLLAASSVFFKQRFTGNLFDCTAGNIPLDDLTPSQLEAFRDFLYKSELPIDEGMVDALKRFASRYHIDSLAQLCGLSTDQREGQEGNTIWSKQLENLLSQLHDMYQKSELATTFLEDSEGSTQFTVHSPLMAAASGKLKNILSNDLFAQGSKYRLKVTANTLGDLIEYIYTGEVTLESENVADLLHAACIYEIPALANACCTWLGSELDSDNVIGIWWCARKADSDYTKDLENEAKSFIIADFKSVCQEGEFEELEYEDLKEIIQDDNLCVNGEEDVFSAVVNWVMADEEGRSLYFCDLLHCVRLEDTSVAFLRYVEEHPLVKNCERCLDAVHAKLQTQAWMEQRAFEGIEIGDIQERRSIAEDEPRRYSDEESESDISSLMQTHDSDDNVKRPNKPTPYRGPRKTGGPDMRFSCNRQRLGNRNKDGSPDMRFKVNKEAFGGKSKKKADNSKTKKGPLSTQDAERPLKKDGTPDMRFKVNKEAFIQSSPQKTTKASEAERVPLKKDGTPDRRFAVNKTPTVKSPSTGNIPGPTKRDGTPDMRYAVNKPFRRAASPGAVSQSSTLGGPVKKDGTPDMRYSANKPSSGHRSLSSGYSSGGSVSSFSESVLGSGPGGPLKRDGTPDMRYFANKPSSGHRSLSSGYSSGGSVSSFSESVLGSGPGGPLKRDGTPDRRFAVNKLTYGSPSLCGSSSSLCSSRSSSTGSSYSTSSFSSSSTAPSTRSSDSSSCYSLGSSSSGSSYGGSRSASGPLKRDGTPDMRYAANKWSYGSSSPYCGSNYSSGSSSYRSSYGGSSSCGPLKRDGTPDMRYAVNRRK